jgi:hypothetical protein
MEKKRKEVKIRNLEIEMIERLMVNWRNWWMIKKKKKRK